MADSELDFFTRSDIESSIRRVEELLACGIFEPEKTSHVLFRSAFAETLLLLRDLLWKAERYASRVDFTDDVVVEGRVRDVTDAVKWVRDCVAHVNIDEHFIENRVKFSFNVVTGTGGYSINGRDLYSEYPDDICIFFGGQRLYFQRHVVRAFEEAKSRLLPLVAR